MFRKSHAVHVTFKGFRFHGTTIRDIYSVGIPSMIMQSISSFLVMGLNQILSAFSETAISVLGVDHELQSFVFMPVFGLTHGLMPIMGYNYGAREKRRSAQLPAHRPLHRLRHYGGGYAAVLDLPRPAADHL